MKKNEWHAKLIKGTAIFIVFFAIMFIALSVGTTESTFTNSEQTSGNSYGAWTSVLWTQTTQSDFEAGSLDNVSAAVSPGDVMLVAVTNCTGWYCPWNFRKKITIDKTKVAYIVVNDSLVNFPVLISLTADADLASSALASGNDILFTSADGITKLDHEIENFTSSNGRLIAWVRIPSLPSATNTDIYMYFNNSGASNQQNAHGVWDANYAAVYHMSQSPSGMVLDSTGNHMDLKSYGGMGSGNLVPAQIGDGIYFDGIDDRMNTSGTFTTTNFTIDAWVSNGHTGNWGTQSSPVTNGWETIADIYDPTDPGNVFRDFASYPYSGNPGSLTIADNSLWTRIITRQRGTAWRHIGATYQYYDPNPQAAGYLNGSPSITAIPPTWGQITARISLGAWASDATGWNDFWWGIIDEVRISTNDRQMAWIRTEYNNTYSPSTFYTVGVKESLNGAYAPHGTLASQVKDTGETGARWDAIEWDEGLAGGTDITFDVRAADTSFVKDNTTLSWTSAGGTSPVFAGLPSGRYFQWRATLTTSDTSQTPVLNEVRAYYT